MHVWVHAFAEEAVALADHCTVIPMAGFVESFNISVAAALIMYEAQQQRLRRLGFHGDLTPEQQHLLTAVLMLKAVVSGAVASGQAGSSHTLPPTVFDHSLGQQGHRENFPHKVALVHWHAAAETVASQACRQAVRQMCTHKCEL